MRFVDDGAVDLAVPEDAPNERYVHTKYGFSVKLERRNPYGFVYIAWHKGSPPDELSGAYSSYDIARQAVTNYLDKTGFNKVVDEKPEYEKAEVKKRFKRNAEDTKTLS